MQDIIERFVSPSGKPVRVVVRDGDPWFVAKDVCAALELANHRSSLALLDEDERGVHTVDTPSGRQDMTIVNEAGLYMLILRSRRPEAKAFRRWITHEVIPSIRKHGAYMTPEVERNIVEHPEDAVALVKSLREERERREFVEADRDKLKAKCDKLVREKSWISSSREAKAMSELSIQYGIIRRLKDKVGCLERELKDERKEKEALRLKLDDAKRTIDDLQRKYEDAMRKIEELLPDAEAYRRWLEAWKNGMNRWHDGLADPGQTRLWDDDRELLEEVQQ